MKYLIIKNGTIHHVRTTLINLDIFVKGEFGKSATFRHAKEEEKTLFHDSPIYK